MSSLLLNPVAFYLFGWPIRVYALCITGAMVIALIASILEAKRRGANTDIVLELFIWCIPLAVIFARVLYVVTHPSTYFPINNFEDFQEIFRVDHGGITIIGAILGGILGGLIVAKYKKLNLLELMDFGLPFMLLGQGLGRWGNYANQELYGAEVTSDIFKHFPLGVYIDSTNSWHYAPFFYEMVLDIIGFILLYLIARKSNKRGVAGIGYIAAYGIIRGIMEFVRTDDVTVGSVNITQMGSFLVAAIAIVVIVLILTGVLKTGNSSMLIPKIKDKEGNK